MSSDSFNDAEIYIMNADGTDISDFGVSGIAPSWSPNGSKIAFEKTNADGILELYMMNADGTNITDIGVSYIFTPPVWSSDSSKIAYFYYNYSTNPTTSS